MCHVCHITVKIIYTLRLSRKCQIAQSKRIDLRVFSKRREWLSKCAIVPCHAEMPLIWHAAATSCLITHKRAQANKRYGKRRTICRSCYKRSWPLRKRNGRGHRSLCSHHIKFNNVQHRLWRFVAVAIMIDRCTEFTGQLLQSMQHQLPIAMHVCVLATNATMYFN